MYFFYLAAGFGKRARPLSLVRAKPAFPVYRDPLINLMLKQLHREGLSDGFINFHHLPDTILSRLDTKLSITQIHEKQLTGSAVLREGASESGYLLVINGDIYLDIPVQALLDKIETTGSDGVLLIRQTTDAAYSGLDVADDYFLDIKKDAGEMLQKWMFTGVSIFKRAVLPHFNDISFFSTIAAHQLDIRTLSYDGIWLDFGTPECYFDSVFRYKRRNGGDKGDGAKLAASASSFIASDSSVTNSIVWDGAEIRNSRIDNSIVTDNVCIKNLEIRNKILYLSDGQLCQIPLEIGPGSEA